MSPHLRSDGRTSDDLRPPHIEVGFHRGAEGSVLYRAGGTVVLCTASLDAKVPAFLEGKGKGWVTAEYQMHPRANLRREAREGRGNKAVSGRTFEIQRLIGRSLRAAVDLARLGERQLVVDCDVLEADGGTRTASITGGFLALALALHKLVALGEIPPGVVRAPVAAISVGLLEGDDELLLDLVYLEDSRARVDLNVVATAPASPKGYTSPLHDGVAPTDGDGAAVGIVEIQGTAEGEPISRKTLDAMTDRALSGVARLGALQLEVLRGAQVDLAALFRTKEPTA